MANDMNTIIIENADSRATSLFKQMAKALKVEVHVKKDKAIKYNPELLQRIKTFEEGRSKWNGVGELQVNIELYTK